MGMQIWLCYNKVKGQPTIIWLNLVDLESLMHYTKIQLQSFLGSGEDLFSAFTIFEHGGYLY